MPIRRFVAGFVPIGLLALCIGVVSAQNYPDKSEIVKRIHSHSQISINS